MHWQTLKSCITEHTRMRSGQFCWGWWGSYCLKRTDQGWGILTLRVKKKLIRRLSGTKRRYCLLLSPTGNHQRFKNLFHRQESKEARYLNASGKKILPDSYFISFGFVKISPNLTPGLRLHKRLQTPFSDAPQF